MRDQSIRLPGQGKDFRAGRFSLSVPGDTEEVARFAPVGTKRRDSFGKTEEFAAIGP